MNNPNSNLSSQQVQLPANLTKNFLQTVGIAAVLILVIVRWNDFIGVFTNILVLIYSGIVLVPFLDSIGAFGITIILFTLLIRLATYPMMAKQIKSSTDMQAAMQSKEWQAIQKKFKDDKEKLAAEQMKFYQDKGISPFSSCLPSLLQFPIMIALYQSVIRAVATSPLDLLKFTRGIYPFIDAAKLIPLHSNFLWMNLGQPEGLRLPFEVSFLQYGFPVLALLVAITTFVQFKVTQTSMPTSPDPNDQTTAMNRTMGVYMPLMLGYFALSYASGLGLYLLTSNLLTVGQYALMGKVKWRNLFSSQPQLTKK